MQELLIFSEHLIMRTNTLKSKETELFNPISLLCLITGNITRNIKKKCPHVGNIASMLQPKVLGTNDSSNAILNNNQVLRNNLASVVETILSEKEINAEEQQESGSNDSQSETLQIFENLNSTENVSEPDFDISSSIGTNKELLHSKPIFRNL